MMKTKHLKVRAYDSNNLEVRGTSDGQGSFKCKLYKGTSWYQNLPWIFTLLDIEYYTIEDEDGKVLERIIHHNP